VRADGLCPESHSVAEADTVRGTVEGNIGEIKTQGGQPGTSTSRLAGTVEISTHVRVAQEPGRS